MRSRNRRIVGTALTFCGLLLSVPTAKAALVGWWTFDGDVKDSSGKGNHGELFDAVFSNDVPAVIGSGKSLSFEEDAQHVFVEENPSLDSPTFTLSMFVYDRGQTGAMERLTSRQGDTLETALNVHVPFNGQGEYSYYAPSSGWKWGTQAPPLEKWQHLAYVADGEEISIYADGKLVGDPLPFAPSPSGFMHIGNRHNNVEGFDGILDDVALWDEPLSAQAIANLASGARRPNNVLGGGIQGDFNNNGVLDAADIDRLTQEIIANTNGTAYDLNKDQKVNLADHSVWVVDLKKTYSGDANLDGQFDSSDFVQVFQRGQYEDTAAGNSGWADGDWNADREFNSSDFVAAFQGGGFEKGPRPAVSAVPEPSSLSCLSLGLLLITRRFRRR